MNTAKRIRNVLRISLVTMAMAVMTIGTAHADVLYFDDFDGVATTDLHGTTPDVTIGANTWVAASNYKADGSSTALNQSTMSLAFAPTNGLVYTLDADIQTVGGSSWVQFGFGGTQPTTGVNWTTRPWMLLRQAGTDGHSASAGSGMGTAGLVGWTSLSDLDYDMDVRIVLDTTGGDGAWTATWFAKAGSDATYTEVRSETTLDTTQDDITSVGFSTYNSGDNTVQFNSFSLSTPPPDGTVFFIK